MWSPVTSDSWLRAWLDELHASFEPHHLQFGFISHLDTRQASMLAADPTQQNRYRDISVFAANLDARKCFDQT